MDHSKNTPDPVASTEIQFQKGTLSVKNNNISNIESNLPFLKWDHRTASYRCHADKYRELIRFLYKNNICYSDFAPKYNKLSILLKTNFTPFDYQSEALNAWNQT